MRAILATIAVGCCLGLGTEPASAASAVLERFGELTLVLPDAQWPSVRTEENPPGAGTAWTRVVFDDPEGRSSIVVFATTSSGNRFAKLDEWISRQEVVSFLTWSVGKYDSGDFQRTASDVSSVTLTNDVGATLFKEELTVNGDARRAWMLSFADPDNEYWYWIGFYSKEGLVDHAQALEKTKAGLTWAGRAAQ